jgi:uncharacterized protein (TIGR02145 family)
MNRKIRICLETLLPILLLSFTRLGAQDYTISFAGSGASTSIDSVIVHNLTQGTSLIIPDGNQLQLVGALTGMNPTRLNPETGLHIFPNPAYEEVEIAFSAISDANTELDLYDLFGRQIAETKAFLTCGRHSFRISGLNSGTYIIQVRSKSYQYHGKIISHSSTGNPTRILQMGQTKEDAGSGTLKNARTLMQMQYNLGDRLKFTANSGRFSTISTDIPRASKIITFNFISCTDGDSNHYATVKINNKVWMAENLKTTKYSDGALIPNVTDAVQWASLSTGAWCNFENQSRNALTYGRLYNWYAVNDSRNICPPDWHVPTDAEWTAVANYLGGEAVAGGKMKETGTDHWLSPNLGATNETGLTIIAGGYRYENGRDFPGFKYGGSYWTKTAQDATTAFNRDIFYYTTACNYNACGKRNGLSIRCIKN